MNFHVLTLFPDIIINSLNYSIVGRAISDKLITVNTVDIRQFSGNKHNRVDDSPYGGGAGMVIKAEPIYKAYNSIVDMVGKNTRVVYVTPSGKPYKQQTAKDLSKQDDLIIICGHYEGIDQRVIDEIVTDEISIGDFVLTGGEIAATVIIDSVARLIPNVLGKEESFMFESFTDNLLEYPHYTRPREFLGRLVPEVLLNGHHKEIEIWRKNKSIEKTQIIRPDLFE